ncbi:2-amino-3,7-dideoxy-D-threo-hept-6-ulosonate synthase [Halococcoides cellulosivorans]|uniref:2-amino-3,7-dideoxy-D-threo-hept-6-ulosonate synthase n=1 Tax=Halococcoides cellulosivorans TaxID=1679096 RepID=A0A2R4WXS3_9EURY|nr:2-amino-3,7-dideoxy-D-threo-hept-6-ulosonate synthase [Halococcoides cellulosivorans]AWB26336.1 fructose-bisphosphate aldolase [Halococcoides cellulosivorans]
MTAGTRARLTRIGNDDRYIVVPVDHGLTMGPVDGLRDVESTVDAITDGGATAVLSHRGIADRVHANLGDAGYIVHTNGATTIGPDEDDKRRTASVDDAVRAGADAVSFHINVGSQYESQQLTDLAEITSEAERLGMPVLAMAYARGEGIDGSDPDALAHAVRIAEEVGCDVIKTAYSGDAESFETVVAATTKPVLIAGGAKGTDEKTIEMVRGAMDAGAAGVSMGRSIFQHADPEAITQAVAAVVFDDHGVEAALDAADL